MNEDAILSLYSDNLGQPDRLLTSPAITPFKPGTVELAVPPMQLATGRYRVK